MLENHKGITLIALVITIIIMLILASVTIGNTIQGVNKSKENKLFSELEMIQHALTERYTKYQLTKDESLLVGTPITEELPTGISWKLNNEDNDSSKKYYKLTNSDLNELGMEQGVEGETEYTYIVNYYTGEVYNTLKEINGMLLYVSKEITLNNMYA